MHRSGAAMAWNVFKFCTALRGLGSVMILLVLGIVGVTYYALILCNYGPALLAATGVLEAFVALAVVLLFHFLLIMLLWSYFSVVFTDPGGVPPNWRSDVDEESGETAPLSTAEFSGLMNSQQSMALSDTGSPRIRYCRKCNQLKPPRCHHCSVCKFFLHRTLNLVIDLGVFGSCPNIASLGGRCVLKMDHHCVWVVNCVGALNYKFFLLFLFYTFLETSLVTLSLLPHFIAFFSDVEIPGTPGALATTFLTFVLNLAFTLSVLGFMIMHAYEKKTTPFWKYDLGRKRNFAQVFGNNKWYWFIPSYSEEDLRIIPALQGLDYPVRSDFDGQGL
ncbi:putative protein S-acyltransferase 14 [Dichanthelium oligosanthes]|uniref:S-acyltransferase n=1 Tax=Dichanthelium oligosanthes TaxID=888268 RepID=A0A1E5V613_9POAL|nr:putative protein S-acyltransferase 14 [Dichanthelium oligosanthes]